MKKINFFSILALIVAVSLVSCDKKNVNPDVEKSAEEKPKEEVDSSVKWQAETLTYDSENEDETIEKVTIPYGNMFPGAKCPFEIIVIDKEKVTLIISSENKESGECEAVEKKGKIDGKKIIFEAEDIESREILKHSEEELTLKYSIKNAFGAVEYEVGYKKIK